MPNATTSKSDHVTADKNGTHESAGQAEELLDRASASATKIVEMHLSATEKATETLADMYLKAADATKLESISEIARAQADVVRKLSDLYVSTTRELLAK